MFNIAFHIVYNFTSSAVLISTNFSAVVIVAKNYTHLQQLTRLINDNGRIREWKSYKEEALKLGLKQNKTWLKTEYDFALAGSTMASKWAEWENRGENILLRYSTVGDARVRDAHRALNGVTLPMSHVFWKTHYTPNGWKCRCDVEVVPNGYSQTPDNIDPNEIDSIPPMMRVNVGKEKLLFGKKHAYYKGEVAKQVDNLLPDHGAVYQQSETNKDVWVSNEVVMPSKRNDKRHLADVEMKKEVGHLLQDHYKTTSFVAPELLPNDFRYQMYFNTAPIQGKVPDNFCKVWWEIESHEAIRAKKKHFTHMLKEGLKQSPYVILYINKTDFTIDKIINHIRSQWNNNDDLKKIETILIKMPNEKNLIEIKKATSL